LKLPKTCPNHPGRPVLRYYRECLECVNERTEKSVSAREERRQAKEQARAQKEQAKALNPPFDWQAPRPMRSKGGRLEKATAFMKEGKANREIWRLTGMSKNTTAKLREILEKQNGGPFLCSCGRPATHREGCSDRVSRSILQCPILILPAHKKTPKKII
jgi:hypothetical protein